MADIRLSESEMAALYRLPPMAWVLYLELRRRMDFSDGTVGVRVGAGISWLGLREALEVEAHPGLVETGKPSESKVRRLLKWLVKRGLVQERTVGKRLQFFLPMAVTDRFARNKPDSNPTGEKQVYPDRQPNSSDVRNGATSAQQPDRQPDSNPTGKKQAYPDTHPVSGKEDHSVDTVGGAESDQRARVQGRFAMRSDWEPSREELWAHLKLIAVPRETCTPEFVQEQLGEFRSYRMATDERWSEARWVQLLASQLKRAWRKSQEAGNATRSKAGRSSAKRRDFIGEDIEALRRGVEGDGGDGHVPDGPLA